MFLNLVGNFDVFTLSCARCSFVAILELCCIARGIHTSNYFCMLAFSATLLIVAELGIEQDSSC